MHHLRLPAVCVRCRPDVGGPKHTYQTAYRHHQQHTDRDFLVCVYGPLLSACERDRNPRRVPPHVQGTVVHPPGMREERPRTLSGEIEPGRTHRCGARERERGCAWSIRAKMHGNPTITVPASLVSGGASCDLLQRAIRMPRRGESLKKVFAFFTGMQWHETLGGSFARRTCLVRAIVVGLESP
jgi:hypothetical protein